MEQAATSLAMANDPASLEQVAGEFAGTQTALEALSRLGDLQYHSGRYAEAASTYDKILREYASNPLAESARLGLAAIQEAQGNFDAARGSYWRIVELNPASFIAIAARMGTARCLELLGQAREARQIYEEMLAGLQGSPWQQEAYLRWVTLGRDLPAISPSATEPEQGTQLLNQPSFPLGGIPTKAKP
jgi:tetratricopeptide (TPR) repeat protein